MVILDALAALCAQKKPSFVAIGLRLTKPIELLVATNDKSLPNAVVSQLNTICKIVKKISDHKYNYGFPSVDINKSSLPSSYDNAEEEEFYENLLFQIYSYSWENITPQTLQELGCNPKCNSTRDREANVKITPVTTQRSPLLQWPATTDEWLKLMKEIYKNGNWTLPGQEFESLEIKIAKIAGSNREAATVHCECSTVAHAHRYKSPPIFSYVGVSKLSSKWCFQWIIPYNCIMGTCTSFRAKGIHDKWYPGWARPGLGNAQIQSKVDTEFSDSIESELCQNQVESGAARPRAESDSTCSSEIMIPICDNLTKTKEATVRKYMWSDIKWKREGYETVAGGFTAHSYRWIWFDHTLPSVASSTSLT